MLYNSFTLTLFVGLLSATSSLASNNNNNNNEPEHRQAKIVAEAGNLPAEQQQPQASSIPENFRILWQAEDAEELRAQARQDLQLAEQRASEKSRHENEAQQLIEGCLKKISALQDILADAQKRTATAQSNGEIEHYEGMLRGAQEALQEELDYQNATRQEMDESNQGAAAINQDYIREIESGQRMRKQECEAEVRKWQSKLAELRQGQNAINNPKLDQIRRQLTAAHQQLETMLEQQESREVAVRQEERQADIQLNQSREVRQFSINATRAAQMNEHTQLTAIYNTPPAFIYLNDTTAPSAPLLATILNQAAPENNNK